MSARPTSRLTYLQASLILSAVFGLCWAAGGPIRVSGQDRPGHAARENSPNGEKSSVVAPVREAPPALAPTFDPHPAYPLTVLSVHDGDTIRGRLAMECGVSVDIDIRLHDFDAPELISNPHGKADPINGPKARDALVKMLDGAAGRLWCKLTGEQTFARWEADLFIIAPDQSIHSVAVMMRAQGWDTGPSRRKGR